MTQFFIQKCEIKKLGLNFCTLVLFDNILTVLGGDLWRF